jgi:hypothetical protein
MALLCYFNFCSGVGGGNVNTDKDGEDKDVPFIMRMLEPVSSQ